MLTRYIPPSRNSVLVNSRSNSVITPLFNSNDHEESDDDLRKEDISFSVADSGPLTPGKFLSLFLQAPNGNVFTFRSSHITNSRCPSRRI